MLKLLTSEFVELSLFSVLQGLLQLSKGVLYYAALPLATAMRLNVYYCQLILLGSSLLYYSVTLPFFQLSTSSY